jgi:drug/metabolite transporter (DMT)-like permease
MKGNALMMLASIIWGFAFVAQRFGAEFIDPFSFNAVRFAMGVGVLLIAIFTLSTIRKVPWQRRWKLWRQVLGPGLVLGLILAIAVGLQQAAMSTVEASKAAFITGFYMVLVPIVLVFRGQRFKWQTVLGVALGFVGLYLVAVKGDFSIGEGDLLLIATNIFWTAHILVVDHYAPKVSALRLSTMQFTVTAIVSAIVAPFVDPHPFTGMDQAIWAVLYAGFISVGVAYTLQVVGQRYTLPTPAGLILCTEALWGAVGGALILHELMDVRFYVGAALMLAGLVVSQLGVSPKPLPVTNVIET